MARQQRWMNVADMNFPAKLAILMEECEEEYLTHRVEAGQCLGCPEIRMKLRG